MDKPRTRYARSGEIAIALCHEPLVFGSALSLTGRGEHELKGVPERWAVFAAE